MQRYFISPDNWTEHHVSIDGEEAKHMRKVMRMDEGDQIICCNNEGDAFLAAIEVLHDKNDSVRVKLLERLESKVELPVHVTVVQGMPKRDKLEWVVQKGTELGMGTLYPYQAERSVVKWPVNKESKKIERLNKIAKEAAEQSHRTRIPDISSPLTLDKLIKRLQHYDLCLVAFEDKGKQGEQAGLPAALSQIKGESRVAVIIGPEGGFSPGEMSRFEAAGCIMCGLGPRILRAETAPIYLLSAISYHYELLNEVR